MWVHLAGSEASEQELEATVTSLYEVSNELEKITAELAQKVNDLDRQYQVKKQPLYEKRGQIIAKLPEFWLTALLHHPILSDAISDNDVKLLKHLTKLDVLPLAGPDQNGFKVVLNFEANQYISDTQVWRSYEFKSDGSVTASSSGVHFLPNMNYTSKKSSTQAATAAAGSKREQPAEDNFIDSFLLDEHSKDNSDLEIFELIKEDIWSDPLKYFLDENGEDMDDDDEDDDDDDDEDVDDEDDN